MIIERWSFLDAIYMTVITLTTVGYNEVHTLSTASYQLSAGITWNASGLPAGVYCARVRAGNRTLTKKLILSR